MNIVLDLGANIECNEKNLIDFSLWVQHSINHYLTTMMLRLLY